MRQYKHLDADERSQISAFSKAGYTLCSIAKELGRSKSTISHEMSRNRGERGYWPKQANQLYINRRVAASSGSRITPETYEEVERLLVEHQLSPEQISGRIAIEGGSKISHETIYKHIKKNKREGGTLHKHLRCKKIRRKQYGSGLNKRGKIQNRVDIDERPKSIEERKTIGHWEGDTVIGANHQQALVTIVERKSRYTVIKKVNRKTAAEVSAATIELLAQYGEKVKSITYDNGLEFAGHETINEVLGIKSYFAKPYHSWERGTNENTNGLIRQYFPKKMPFHSITDEQVQAVQDKLNRRPRKCLGYRTPEEVFLGNGKIMRMTYIV